MVKQREQFLLASPVELHTELGGKGEGLELVSLIMDSVAVLELPANDRLGSAFDDCVSGLRGNNT